MTDALPAGCDTDEGSPGRCNTGTVVCNVDDEDDEDDVARDVATSAKDHILGFFRTSSVFTSLFSVREPEVDSASPDGGVLVLLLPVCSFLLSSLLFCSWWDADSCRGLGQLEHEAGLEPGDGRGDGQLWLPHSCDVDLSTAVDVDVGGGSGASLGSGIRPGCGM